MTAVRPENVRARLLQVLAAHGLKAYVAALAAAAALLALAWPAPHDIQVPPVRFTWWMVALAFFLVESLPVRLRIDKGHNNVSVSFSEAAKIIGVAFAAPVHLMGGMVVGRLAAELHISRGAPPVKRVFNAALALFESSACVAIYHAVLRGGEPLEPQGWVAAVAAATLTSLFAGVAVGAAIYLRRQAPVSMLFPKRVALVEFISGGVATMLGLLAIVLLAADPRAAPFLIILVALAGRAFRSHGRLTEAHDSMQLMQELTSRIHQGLNDEADFRDLVVGTSELLGADTALWLKAGENDDHRWVSTTVSGKATGVLDVTVLDSLLDLVNKSGEALVVPRDDHGGVAGLLDALGTPYVAVAPVATTGAAAGFLIASRRDVRFGFVQDDLRLLQITASHAGTALHNASLIRALERRVAEKGHEAAHDALTGLINRSKFYEEAGAAVARVNSPGQAIMLIDLDRFKSVNDTAGHHAGDEVLRRSAQRLVQAVRPGDVVARLGGDEFALLLRDLDDVHQIMAITERIHGALSVPVETEGQRLIVGASLGVALYPTDGNSLDELLRCADAAMYKAKRKGGGTQIRGRFPATASVVTS